MGIHDGHRARLRQRFLTAGLDAFADHEALELLISYAIPRKDVNPIAHQLLDQYNQSLAAVLAAPAGEIEKVEGLGESAAVLLSLVFQLSRRARLEDMERQDLALSGVDRVGPYVLELFDGVRREVLYQLCLDRKGKLLARIQISEGGAAATELNVRLLVENAIRSSASGVILTHNHPSGVALPSANDQAATRRAWMALNAIGVELVDHIIVADGDFVSMRQSGDFEDYAGLGG